MTDLKLGVLTLVRAKHKRELCRGELSEASSLQVGAVVQVEAEKRRRGQAGAESLRGQG